MEMSKSILVLIILIWIYAQAMPQQSSTVLASMRRSLYSNLTCPSNCTCKSISRPPNEDFALEIIPAQMVDCDRISADYVKDLFTFIPEGVTSFTLRRSGLSSLMDLCCMDNLESLDLSFNLISDLIVYVEFEKLTWLNLRSNALRILRKDEFISFPNVETLNLDSNEIQIVDQESFRLMRLRELDLSRNQIAYINERVFRYASNLELLNLAGNRLTGVHARNFYFSRALRNLDLSNNQLAHVDEFGFDPLYRLEDLNLSFNNFTRVNSAVFQKLTALKTLTLDSNPLVILENASFHGIPALETLRLDRMHELTMILDGAFDDLPNLKRLSICSCKKLQYISPNAFKNLNSLTELYLTNNALIFIPAPVILMSSLEKCDYAGNPLNCECMRSVIISAIGDRKKSIFTSALDSACQQPSVNGDQMGGKCIPTVVPIWNTNLTKPIGSSISLYCASVHDSDEFVPVWTLPDGRTVTIGQHHRFYVDHERLYISFLLQDDAGRYSCSLSRSGNESIDSIGNIRYVDLYVDTVTSVIFPIDVSAYYVTLTWSQAPSKMDAHKSLPTVSQLQPLRHHRPSPSSPPAGDCRLIFKSEFEDEFVHIELPALWERYTVNRLRPETNYSFCLVYARDDVALYKYCTYIRTEKAYVHFGVSLNYSLIALLAISISLICGLCIARCVHKRLHIWQEEKYRGRMQESMSAQGFLSSFESLTSHGSLASAAASAITYENRGALDTVSRIEESEGTALNEFGHPTISSSGAKISCRKHSNIGQMMAKQSTVVVAEMHAST